MKTVERNKKYIYFTNPTSYTEVTDEWGNATGQFNPTYANVSTALMSESAGRGNADMDLFGISTSYNKTLVTSIMDMSITEKTVMWLGYGKVESFSATTSYTVGTLVIYGDSLYTCTTAHTGTWNSADFTVVPYNYIVVGVAKSLNSVSYAVREVTVNG